MPRQAFDRQLAELERSTIILGEQVETAVHQAVQAFTTRDLALAQKVVDEDAGINRMELQILDEATTLLTLQAPVASDLRRILGVSRVAGNLERMGDHARNIGRTTLRVANTPPIEPLIDLPALIAEVLAMLRDGLRCYAETDIELARVVCAADDQVDRSFASLFRELLGYMLADTAVITRATYTLLVGQDMERIADRVTNIAETVIYVATGRMEDLN